jgi:mannose-6-phosphate isomerase-like protein (cupin superfamily)
MYNIYRKGQNPYEGGYQMYDPTNMYNVYPYPCFINMPMYYGEFLRQLNSMYNPFFNDGTECDTRFDLTRSENSNKLMPLKDYGPEPFVINIDKATKENKNYRTTIWTGKHLQVTLMSIDVGGDIGLEIHPYVDQFIRIEEGQGITRMGKSKCNFDFEKKIYEDSAIMIPAGTWHNIINTGNKPLKLYSIYAPPEHPRGTVHVTKADSEAEEKKKK